MSHLYLAHHGIKGMKWGVRRFRNEDGTLTEAGKKRYKIDSKGNLQKLTKEERKAVKDEDRNVRRFERNYKNNWIDSYNKAADQINQWIPSWNDKFKDYDFSKIDTSPNADNSSVPMKTVRAFNEYSIGYGEKWTQLYSDVLLSDFGEHPTLGKKWVKLAPLMGNPSYYGVSANLNERFARASKDNPKLSYDDIYREMSSSMTDLEDPGAKSLLESEDPSDYRRAEALWYEKHGY